MVKLNDYLYDGNTIFRILIQYSEDLEKSADETGNLVDRLHSEFLRQILDVLERTDFLTAQSRKLLGFYEELARDYPYLAFTFRGRIKSLIRAEEKFNGYIVEYIYAYYRDHESYPPIEELEDRINCFRDFIAYRLVISLPKCHLKPGMVLEEEEKKLLYEISNKLPAYLESQGFRVEDSGMIQEKYSPLLDRSVHPYYRDYVENPTSIGYRSLHIVFRDLDANCSAEIQLRTKMMDDHAEIGIANHDGYEKSQQRDRRRRGLIPPGENRYFDEAFERGLALQQLDLSKVDVNMFAAGTDHKINDGCGLYKGRLILPYEHLSRFQV